MKKLFLFLTLVMSSALAFANDITVTNNTAYSIHVESSQQSTVPLTITQDTVAPNSKRVNVANFPQPYNNCMVVLFRAGDEPVLYWGNTTQISYCNNLGWNQWEISNPYLKIKGNEIKARIEPIAPGVAGFHVVFDPVSNAVSSK